jgi:hypothetical protein
MPSRRRDIHVSFTWSDAYTRGSWAIRPGANQFGSRESVRDRHPIRLADYDRCPGKQFDTQFELQEYTVRTGFSPQPFKRDGRQRLPRADPRPRGSAERLADAVR